MRLALSEKAFGEVADHVVGSCRGEGGHVEGLSYGSSSSGSSPSGRALSRATKTEVSSKPQAEGSKVGEGLAVHQLHDQVDPAG